ncbi:MAG: ammonium transporter [Verrucomicrobiota bacterium]
MADDIAFVVEPDGQISQALFTTNNLWICIAAALVFIMHLGFACLESGLTQAKNTVNILFKNSIIPGLGIITYAMLGFNLMYPGEWMIEGVIGSMGAGAWGIGNFGDEAEAAAAVTAAYYPGYTYWGDFIFQAMFAATAATIVSGCVAERVKLHSFLIFSFIFLLISYPITGSWEWGGGWLDSEWAFVDFAGSSLVHAAGGFAGLACAIVLGPRMGKFKDGKVQPILGHSMPLATIGVFLLWFGWFGFNGGSVLAADPGPVSFVFTTTALAASSGAVGAMLTSWIALKKPDLSMVLNGILAGLVGITAGADVISPFWAVIVGLLAGFIVVFAVIFFDVIKIDDPVGAVSVHGVCGIWGTLCVALFGDPASGATFAGQLIGTLSISLFSFIFALVLFLIIKAIFGVRVSEEEEIGGLDIGEHGQEAYPDFQGTVKG